VRTIRERPVAVRARSRDRPPSTPLAEFEQVYLRNVTDHVVFRFHGYGGYPALLALSGLTLAVVAVARGRGGAVPPGPDAG
jgi:hypothetical protein